MRHTLFVILVCLSVAECYGASYSCEGQEYDYSKKWPGKEKVSLIFVEN